MEEILKAIRTDPVLGRGSASSVDECMTDSELLHLLQNLGITDVEEAIQHFREVERIFWESQGLGDSWRKWERKF